MAYKWRPSASQRKEFAAKMQDPVQKAEYESNKEAKAQIRRDKSRYDYTTAGGSFIPTQVQHNAAFNALNSLHLTDNQRDACNMVMSAYACNDKTEHDHIHVVNEIIRSNNLNTQTS